MKLTENDYYGIIAQMDDKSGSVEYDKDGETLYFDYETDVDGYVEDDFYCGYGNGTGAKITTSATVSISEMGCCNSDGEETDCNFDEYKLAKMFECELMSY